MTINDEAKFFVINTGALWQGGGKIENLLVGGQGISLSKSSDYSYVDTIAPGSVVPRSLDRDACGVLFILDQLKKNILVCELSTGYDRWLHCVSLEDPVSIAVNDTNIYVVDDEKLYCLGRVNNQVRWIKPMNSNARIAALNQDKLYVLDTGDKKVYKIARQWNWQPIQTGLLDANGDEYSLSQPVDIASDRENNFYILEGLTRQVLKFAPNGQLLQVIAIPFKEEAEFLNLAVESSDNIYLGFKISGSEAGGIVRLSKDVRYAATGTYISSLFDSTMDGCRWHRVVLNSDIPTNTRVELSYTASDYEPGIYDSFESEIMVNPNDTLLTGAAGRYIRFKLELFSDEATRETPSVKSLKVYFPRVTYLRYLPETYQENEESREFLERFLSLFETFMNYSEKQIFDFTRFLDSASVPEGFLPWLSSLLAIAQDENWPLEKKRQLVARAMEFYKKRGTPRVISQMIDLFYGAPPIVVEPFQFKCIKTGGEQSVEKAGSVKTLSLEEVLAKLYGTGPYRFTVLVPPRWEDTGSPVKKAQEVTAAERGALQRIVDTEKPAHTTACLKVLEPWIYLDMHTYLEVNTVLTRTRFIVGKTSVIGRDTVIADRETGGQVNRKSRVDIDAALT